MPISRAVTDDIRDVAPELVSPPRVSILFPVRNAEATLPEALESIRGQTFRNWELVAVDDGSTDGSGALLDRAARADGRIRVLHRPPDGLVAALEAARRSARGPLLARMDADDRSEPHRLAVQVRLLDERPHLVGCGGHVRYFPREGLSDGLRRYEEWLNSVRTEDDVDRELWVECPLAHPTLMVRAAAVERVGGYRDLGWPEDYDLVLRLRLDVGPLGVVPELVHHWRDSPNRLSRTAPEYSPDAFRRVRLHHLARSPLLRDRDGLVVWGAGPTGKALARTALAMGIRVLAFVELNPRKIGQEIHGAPVVDPGGVAEFRRGLGVAAVGRSGARDEVRAAFLERGWIEGRDFVAMA